MESTVERAVKAFIVENLAYTDDVFGDDTSLVGTGIVDSVGVLELVTYLETEFHVTPTQQEITLDNFDSVNRIARFVRGRLLAKSQAAD